MKKLILHIGSHKTGTTAIQKGLLENKSKLEKEGLNLFHEQPNGHNYRTGSCSSWISFEGIKSDFKPILNLNILNRLNKLPGNHILSSEEFFWFSDKEEIKNLVNHFKKVYDEIKIIMYIRRQDKQLLSHYQQGFKYQHSSARQFFGCKISPLPKYEPYFDSYLNYFEKAEAWAENIGRSNISIRLFESSKFYQGDIVADFFNCIGTDFQVKGTRVNEALSKFDIAINESLFRKGIGVHNSRVANFIKSQAFVSKPELKKTRFLPSEAQAYDIYERYIDNNRKLNEKYYVNSKGSLFDENGFESYPERADNLSECEIIDLNGDVYSALTNMNKRTYIGLGLRLLLDKIKPIK